MFQAPFKSLQVPDLLNPHIDPNARYYDYRVFTCMEMNIWKGLVQDLNWN